MKLGLDRDQLQLTTNELLFKAAGSCVIPYAWRPALMRRLGADIASDARVSPGCFFGGFRVRIGHGTFVNRAVFFDSSDFVILGDRVHVGMRTTFLTGSHELGGSQMRAAAGNAGPVTVGDGAWIGANVTVLPGVTIGAGCVIAAGAVVTGDCPPDTMCGGIPAKVLRQL